MEQTVFTCHGSYEAVDPWIADRKVHKILLVCGKSIARQPIYGYLTGLPERLGVDIVRFSDFQPNPKYESVVMGVERFREEGCNAIIAVGGGSAIDVAKCIKLFSDMDPAMNYLKQPIIPNELPFLVMPTTAGTGSEATRFAVIYYEGAKQSVSHVSCIPEAVILDSLALQGLPLYQRKATMLDAFSHALEAFWSVNSTDASKAFSRDALCLFFAHLDGYLANTEEGNAGMLMAANIAGKAINITQTTAGHAMCYKITSLFGTAHGHAAALCNRVLLPWMLDHTDQCIDPRGETYLKSTLEEIAQAMGCDSARAVAEKVEHLIEDLTLEVPEASPDQFALLKTSVNPERLKNHPIALDETAIDLLYHQILKEKSHEG